MGSTPAKLDLTKGLTGYHTPSARISVLLRAGRAARAGPPLWLSTHRVNSRQRSISVASGAKRMLTEPRLQKSGFYEYTP
jgi:hypothetical protein